MKSPKTLCRITSFWLIAYGVAACVAKVSGADFSALVFSKTLLYRHTSITNGIAAIKTLGEQNHFHVDATEDSSWFTRANLAKYKVIIFLSTSGEILNEEQRLAFKDFVEQGGKFAAIHAAVAGDLATEGNWPWYQEALCASFTNHSAVVQAACALKSEPIHQQPRCPRNGYGQTSGTILSRAHATKCESWRV